LFDREFFKKSRPGSLIETVSKYINKTELSEIALVFQTRRCKRTGGLIETLEYVPVKIYFSKRYLFGTLLKKNSY
jgi:hypothetical protein